MEFKPFPGIPLKDIFSAAGDDLLDLLGRLLDCNPAGRVNATQVSSEWYAGLCDPKTVDHFVWRVWQRYSLCQHVVFS